MEDFFRKLATFKGQPSPEEGAKLFSDHDMQVVGPPLDYWGDPKLLNTIVLICLQAKQTD